jgi:hypothetical protein
MTKNYAVIENDKVTNVIFADTLEVAEEVTGKECVECDGSFWLNWTRLNGQWVEPPTDEYLISIGILEPEVTEPTE